MELLAEFLCKITKLATYKDSLQAVQALITVVAVLTAGLWSYLLFIRRRQKFPRARLTHEVISKLISSEKRLIRVVITVENVGEVLLEVERGEIHLQRIMPLGESVASKIAMEENSVPCDDEIDWPALGVRELKWEKHELEVEPGEDENLHYDFVIDSDVETIQVYSHLKNRSKKRRDLVWQCTTLVDLTPVERGDSSGRAREGQT